MGYQSGMAEVCAKCGRERPLTISDPTCYRGGYCAWTAAGSTLADDTQLTAEEVALLMRPFVLRLLAQGASREQVAAILTEAAERAGVNLRVSAAEEEKSS